MKSFIAFDILRDTFERGFEGIDAIRAIYGSLPQNIRDFYDVDTAHDILGMVWVIYRHVNLIRVNRMIENLIYNEFVDFIYGLPGRASQIAARRLGLSTGVGFGGAGRLRRAQEIQERQFQVAELIAFVNSETETFR